MSQSSDVNPRYAIGDRVIATCDIREEGNEHSPAVLYATKGDLLIVQRLELLYPVHVLNADKPGSGFGVELDEIRPAPAIAEPEKKATEPDPGDLGTTNTKDGLCSY